MKKYLLIAASIAVSASAKAQIIYELVSPYTVTATHISITDVNIGDSTTRIKFVYTDSNGSPIGFGTFRTVDVPNESVPSLLINDDFKTAKAAMLPLGVNIKKRKDKLLKKEN